jgi:hypothetical protein
VLPFALALIAAARVFFQSRTEVVIDYLREENRGAGIAGTSGSLRVALWRLAQRGF